MKVLSITVSSGVMLNVVFLTVMLNATVLSFVMLSVVACETALQNLRVNES